VTIAVNEWQAVQSNNLLEKTCLKESSAFFPSYHSLKSGKAIPSGKEMMQDKHVRISGETASVGAYFVSLPHAVRFRGVTKSY